MPRAASPSAVRTMNGLLCPAPAPCATTRAAAGEPPRYTFSSMRTASFSAALFFLSAATASAQRLPSAVTPLHYDITVTPRLAEATFGGNVVIRLRLASPSSTIVLNAAEIKFGSASISAGGRIQKAEVVLDPAKEQAAFRVPAALPAGDAELTIAYEGILNDDLRGLYLSKANNRRY